MSKSFKSLHILTWNTRTQVDCTKDINFYENKHLEAKANWKSSGCSSRIASKRSFCGDWENILHLTSRGFLSHPLQECLHLELVLGWVGHSHPSVPGRQGVLLLCVSSLVVRVLVVKDVMVSHVWKPRESIMRAIRHSLNEAMFAINCQLSAVSTWDVWRKT